MNFVDTHCHIQSADSLKVGEKTTRELWTKLQGTTGSELVKNAVANGVKQMLCVGCDLEDSELAIEFVADKPECFATIGIHPHEARHFVGKTDLLDKFSGLADRPKVVAVGECGLDYFYEHSPKAGQIEILKFQLNLAKKYDLPVIFHVREAFADFWPIFDEFSGLRGVLHSYTDNSLNLKKALDRGLYIGVNGIATFAKDPAQIEVYRTIPIQNLLIETDSPYLTPIPYRGNINEPKYVTVVAEFLAKLRNQDISQISFETTRNVHKLFGV